MDYSDATKQSGNVKVSSNKSRIANVLRARQRGNDLIINSNDSQPSIFSVIYNYIKPYDPRLDLWTKDTWILCIYVLSLVIAISLERVTFKMAVDRMIPFRYLLNIILLLISTAVYSVISLIKRSYMGPTTSSNFEYIHHSVIIKMAILDSISFSGLIVSASGVTPTMTLILLHASTPCIVWGTLYVFPQRTYSEIQNRGVIWITVAILSSISRPIWDLIFENDSIFILSSFVYLISALIQGFATLYKEKCIISFATPIDTHYMSSWLFFYQFLFTLMLSPLLYIMQDVTSFWGAFQLSNMRDNLINGFECLQGLKEKSELNNDFHSECQGSIWLILGYVLSNVAVLACIDQVLQTSNQILGRVMAFGVFFAFIALGIYDTHEYKDYGGLNGGTIGFTDLISLVFLIIGMEIYGSDPEPDAELVANFYSNSAGSYNSVGENNHSISLSCCNNNKDDEFDDDDD